MPQPFLDIPAELAPRLAPVQAMLAEGLARVEQRFDAHLASDLLPVEQLCGHIERYRGKMLRPSLVMLCGLACGDGARETGSSESRATGDSRLGEPCHRESRATTISDDHVTLAAVCEMVHMATLVHDDVLDEAENRRRGRTVNHLYGNEAAVILGDYLIAGAYHLCTTVDSLDAARLIGEVSMTLCGGELLQLHYRDDYSLDEPTYFAILERKTAALIGVSCRLGAMLAGAAEATQAGLETFGRRLGVAFQIQDDLMDLLGTEAVVGKSVGKDLEKGKLTLPILLHLGSIEPTARGGFLEQLQVAGRAEHDARQAAAILRDQLLDSGAVEAARAHANSLVGEACSQLAQLPTTPARELLGLMAKAVVTRLR